MSTRKIAMLAPELRSIEELQLKNGGRLDIWMRFHAEVDAFIRKTQPSQITVGIDAMAGAPAAVAHAAEAKVTKAPIVWDGGKWGGMKYPHLHFAGQVYYLTDEQWRSFSQEVLGKLTERMKNVHSVTFDQLMDLSDAIESI
jgi:hypothetical protein